MKKLISALGASRLAPTFRPLLRGVVVVMIVALTLANGRTALANWMPGSSAHDSWKWHWDESTLSIYVSGSHGTEAVRARNVWNGRTNLTLRSVSYPPDAGIQLFGQYFGATGWAGLNTHPSFTWDWHCWNWCRIVKSVAIYNSYYRSSNSWYAQKVFCHELGHAFGFGHNSTGGCMISGYWPDLSNAPSSHDVSDVNAQY